MKKTNNDGKSKPDTVKLWAVDVCPADDQPGMTVVLLASSIEDALRRAEQRYPQYFADGSRVFAQALSSCKVRRDGSANRGMGRV